jgi:hypothetical protein
MLFVLLFCCFRLGTALMYFKVLFVVESRGACVVVVPHISYDSWRSQAQLYWRSGTRRSIPQPIFYPSHWWHTICPSTTFPLVAFRDPPLFQTEPVLQYLRRRRPVLTIRLHPSLCLRYRNQSVSRLSPASLSRPCVCCPDRIVMSRELEVAHGVARPGYSKSRRFRGRPHSTAIWHRS